MKVAIAPHLSGTDILIGSLNEVIEAGVVVPPEIARILRQPRVLAFSLAVRAMGKTWPEAKNIAVKMFYKRLLGENPPHPEARLVASILGDQWTRYQKFCFVRNPYTQAASDYYWRKRATGLNFSFLEFLEAVRNKDDSRKIVHPGALSNWQMMAIDDNLQMDFVGRYENLQADFSRISTMIGLPGLTLDTKEKAGNANSDYGSLYGETEKKLVALIFDREINAFGYSYPY